MASEHNKPVRSWERLVLEAAESHPWSEEAHASRGQYGTDLAPVPGVALGTLAPG
jgi:hypothetical protein